MAEPKLTTNGRSGDSKSSRWHSLWVLPLMLQRLLMPGTFTTLEFGAASPSFTWTRQFHIHMLICLRNPFLEFLVASQRMSYVCMGYTENYFALALWVYWPLLLWILKWLSSPGLKSHIHSCISTHTHKILKALSLLRTHNDGLGKQRLTPSVWTFKHLVENVEHIMSLSSQKTLEPDFCL